MKNWRESVDKSLRDHLELQIKEACNFQESYEKANNKGLAQLWIAVSNISKEVFNLELKIKFLESSLKEVLKLVKSQKPVVQKKSEITIESEKLQKPIKQVKRKKQIKRSKKSIKKKTSKKKTKSYRQ